MAKWRLKRGRVSGDMSSGALLCLGALLLASQAQARAGRVDIVAPVSDWSEFRKLAFEPVTPSFNPAFQDVAPTLEEGEEVESAAIMPAQSWHHAGTRVVTVKRSGLVEDWILQNLDGSPRLPAVPRAIKTISHGGPVVVDKFFMSDEFLPVVAPRHASSFVCGWRPTDVGIGIEALASADFDHDGLADIAVADVFGSVGLARNQDYCSFDFPRTFHALHGGRYVDYHVLTTADVNTDGNPDLLVSMPTEIAVLLGNGNGTFQPVRFVNGQNYFAITNPNAYQLNQPKRILVRDANRDGRADLIVLGTFVGAVGVMYGTGNGFTYSNPAIYALFDPSRELAKGTWLADNIGARDMAAGDFNGDGTEDLFVLRRYWGPVVLSGYQSGGFAAYANDKTYLYFTGAGLALSASVNTDNRTDLLIFSQGARPAGFAVLHSVP